MISFIRNILDTKFYFNLILKCHIWRKKMNETFKIFTTLKVHVKFNRDTLSSESFLHKPFHFYTSFKIENFVEYSLKDL